MGLPAQVTSGCALCLGDYKLPDSGSEGETGCRETGKEDGGIRLTTGSGDLEHG